MSNHFDSYHFNDHMQNTTFEGVTFTINDTGGAIDLTGVNITFYFYRGTPGGPLKYTKGTYDSNEVEITNATSGIFEFKRQLIDFEDSLYYYHADFVFPDGSVKTYLKGTWNVIKQTEGVT